MILNRSQQRRRGTVLPMLAATIVVLMGFVALAIDLGMMAISKVQAQNDADIAALTALRELNGSPTTSPSTDYPNQNGAYNSNNAAPAGFAAAGANYILGSPPGATTILVGSYTYSNTLQSFSATFPAAPNNPGGNASAIITPQSNLSAVQAIVTSSSNNKTYFAGVFGVSMFKAVSATATAVFRPRDFSLVMDFSGSMSLGSQMAYAPNLFQIPFTRSNNPDTTFPQFGPYGKDPSGNPSAAALQYTGAAQTAANGSDNYYITPTDTSFYDPANTTRAPMCLDFYQVAATVTPKVRAFTSETLSGSNWNQPAVGAVPQIPGGWNSVPPATSANCGPTAAGKAYATTPGGDQFAFVHGSTTNYASDVGDIINGSSNYNTYNSSTSPAGSNWERDGYDYVYAGNDPANNTSWGATYYQSTSAAYTAVAGGGITPTGTAATYTSPYSNFQGYTQGPTFWGKTFFMWPPDPRYPLTTSNTGVIQMYLNDLGVVTTNKNSAGTTYTWAPTTRVTNAQSIYGSTAFWQKDGGAALSTLINGMAIATNGNNGTTASTGTTEQQTTITSNSGGGAGYQIYCAIMRLYNRSFMISSPNFTFVAGTGGGTPADWRRRFFNNTNDNTALFDGNANWKAPAPNYQEIMYWLKNCGPCPFPTELHAGNITYYRSLPTNPGNNSTNDEKFWKLYIDWVLMSQTGSNGSGSALPYSSKGSTGYGSWFNFGSTNGTINAPTTPPSTTTGANSPPSDTKYMNYTDNPDRPNTQMWFGPLSMVDMLSNESYWTATNINRNWLPGDCHESPLYSAKVGVSAALTDMQSNQPNDMMTLIYYSAPLFSSSLSNSGCFNCVRAPLGITYNYAISSLWFPQVTLNTDGTTNGSYTDPLGSSAGEIFANVGGASTTMMLDVPHSKYGTCFAMGLMLAYNQYVCTDPTDGTLRTFVTSANYPSGMAGGLGRIGAQKVVIFETDGIVNTVACPSGGSSGYVSRPAVGNTPAYHYMKIRFDPTNLAGSEYPGGSVLGTENGTYPGLNAYWVIDQMKNDLGTTRKPFRLYALGFGPIFQSGSPDAPRGLGTLAQMQATGTPTATSTPIALATNQQIVGTDDQMAVLLQAALTTVMQGALQCALIQTSSTQP
ncbi:hypothetical protein AYO40_01570 [Planctomycetaceae bacterium SCGC AG-212-D15]|nr:hypothetical protein AYO40_01570 [Planctomycetaceae bacterium SCGC AG-212-D15]